MSYLRYQRYPGILRFWYLPYRLDQVFSAVIPTIPTRTPVFWYLPYQLDLVFSNAIPTIPMRTTVWHTPRIYRGNPGKYPTRCTTHGAAVGPNSTQVFRAVGCSVTVVANIYDHRLWCRGWGCSWVCSGIRWLLPGQRSARRS